MIKIRKRLILAVVLILISGANNSYALTAEEIVREASQEVLNRLHEDRERLEKDPGYIKTIVKDLIIPHFDFVIMSRLVLGKHWKSLNELEQACFTVGFRELLVARYADVFLGYKDQKISYGSENTIGEVGYVSVRQIISHPVIDPFVVDYPMKPEGDGWKVVDLIVDDVSLIKVYRVNFKHEIQKHGLQNLLIDINNCNN